MKSIAVLPNSTIKNKTGGWRTYIPCTDYNKCTGCGTCARLCPENAIVMVQAEKKQKPKIDYNYCKGCGLCAEECPVKAVVMEKEEK